MEILNHVIFSFFLESDNSQKNNIRLRDILNLNDLNPLYCLLSFQSYTNKDPSEQVFIKFLVGTIWYIMRDHYIGHI